MVRTRQEWLLPAPQPWEALLDGELLLVEEEDQLLREGKP